MSLAEKRKDEEIEMTYRPDTTNGGMCLTCSRPLTELRQQAGDLFTRWVCVHCTTGASPPLYPYVQTPPAPPGSVTFIDPRDADLATLRAQLAEVTQERDVALAECARYAVGWDEHSGRAIDAEAEVERLTQDHGDLLVANARERARAEKAGAEVGRLREALRAVLDHEKSDECVRCETCGCNSMRCQGCTACLSHGEPHAGDCGFEMARAALAPAETPALPTIPREATYDCGEEGCCAPAETKGEG